VSRSFFARASACACAACAACSTPERLIEDDMGACLIQIHGLYSIAISIAFADPQPVEGSDRTFDVVERDHTLLEF
jgi:hypothetical protein